MCQWHRLFLVLPALVIREARMITRSIIRVQTALGTAQ
jgi:hypothetical protein